MNMVYTYIYYIYSIYKTIRCTLYITYTDIRWRPPVYLREIQMYGIILKFLIE